MDLADTFSQLEGYIESLKLTVEEHKKEFLETMGGKRPLIEGCPSKGAQGRLIFRQIEKKLQDVVDLASDVREKLDVEGST